MNVKGVTHGQDLCLPAKVRKIQKEKLPFQVVLLIRRTKKRRKKNRKKRKQMNFDL